MSFDTLGLSEPLLKAIRDLGYEQPTEIQARAIPLVLQGGDLMAGAQTGTGKTAGFTLPILERLKASFNTSVSPARHPVRALILTPTRELAMQVEESVRAYSKHLPAKSTVIYGGVNMDAQEKILRAGVDIVVATPGRLLDHIGQKNLTLNQVEVLVLDEADRMLDMGFIPDIRKILALLPAKRQSLLFSATFSDEIRRLADTMLKAPTLIEAARRNSASENITQKVYLAATAEKLPTLLHLLEALSLQQALVFTRTKQGASRLTRQLEKAGLPAVAIHGDKTQPERTQALESFKHGEARVMVATDVAARGLDIEQLPCVFNYELPTTPEDYVHRIGRTGRAGAAGLAISLVSHEEMKPLADIEKLIKKQLPRESLQLAPEAAEPRRRAPRDDSGRRHAPASREEGGRRHAPASRDDDGRRHATDEETPQRRVTREPEEEAYPARPLWSRRFAPVEIPALMRPANGRPGKGRTAADRQRHEAGPTASRNTAPVAALLRPFAKPAD